MKIEVSGLGHCGDRMQKVEQVWREINEGCGFHSAVIKLHVGQRYQ